MALAERAMRNRCRPYDWMKDFPVAVKVPEDLARQVKAKWGDKFLD